MSDIPPSSISTIEDAHIVRLNEVIPIYCPDLNVGATALPRPVTFNWGLTSQFWMSGDRWLNTPSPFNGGQPGTGLGTMYAIPENELYEVTWGDRPAPEWPAFGGTWAGSELFVGTPNSECHSAAFLGWFELPNLADGGIPFAVFAGFDVDTTDGVFAEIRPYLGGDQGQGEEWFYQDVEDSAQEGLTLKLSGGGFVVYQEDKIEAYPIPGAEMPAALVVWTESGVLHATKISTTYSTSGNVFNTAPHLVNWTGPIVNLGHSISYDSKHLEFTGQWVNGGVVIAWRTDTGISVGKITVTETTNPVLTNVVQALTGSFSTVDCAQVSGDRFVVIGRDSDGTGGAWAIVDTSTGTVTQSSGPLSSTFLNLRGSTVAGRVCLLYRTAAGWSVAVYNQEGTSTTTFSAGPLSNNGTTQHEGSVLGNPDGRVAIYIRNRDVQYSQPFNPGEPNYPDVKTWGTLNLFTYSSTANILTLRDTISPPFGSDGSPEYTNPLRLRANTDQWISLEMGPGGVGAWGTWLISWHAMPPSMWFAYLHWIGGNRYAQVWTPATIEEWGAYVLVDGQLEGGNQGFRQTVVVIELDEDGDVSGISNPVMVNAFSYGWDMGACGDGDTMWIVSSYVENDDVLSTGYLELTTLSIGDGPTLSVVNEVVLDSWPYDSILNLHTGSDTQLGHQVYMGDNTFIWFSYTENCQAIKVNADGTVAQIGPKLNIASTGHLMRTWGGINNTNTVTSARVGETDICAITTKAGAEITGSPYYGWQNGVMTIRLDRSTLGLSIVDYTTPWDQSNPTSPCDWLGWSGFDSAANIHAFSFDGTQNCFVTEYRSNLKPWSLSGGSQEWMVSSTNEEQIVCWVDISSSGAITVEYQILDFDWKGRFVDGPTADVTALGVVYSGSDVNGGRTDQLTTGCINETDAILLSPPNVRDLWLNPEAWIEWGFMYSVHVVRRGNTTTEVIDGPIPLVPMSKWHSSFCPVPELNGFLLRYDYPMLPMGRASAGDWQEMDAFTAAVKFMGGAPVAPRGTAQIGSREVDMWTYPEIFE